MKNNKKKKVIGREFKPTSKSIQYIDYSLGYKFKTAISYEYGIYKGKSAIRFYIDGVIESVRHINKKNTGMNFKLYNCGGQTLHSVRRQREKCLELIVKIFFETIGFKVKLKPKINVYQPDVLIKKDDLTCFIELKAYHESYICGDTEISQVMKYFRETTNLMISKKKSVNLPSKPKLVLITSGSLINPHDSFLNNENLDPIQFVNSYYKKLIIPRSKAKSLDDFSRRDIYKQASIKFKKNYATGFPRMNIVFFNESHIQNFPSCLSSNQNCEILLIDSNIFYKLLRQKNLLKEARKFKLLKEKEMERLVINGKILKYP